MLGFLIDIGALVALAAGILACLTAAARVLLLMAHNGLTHSSLRATHARNETPSGAIIATGLAAFLPVAWLAAKGTSGLDVYGWLGSLAVYGFIVSYALVCFALPGYLRDHHGVVNVATKTIPWIAFIAMGSRWLRISTPCPKACTASCPTSSLPIWPRFSCCLCSARVRKPRLGSDLERRSRFVASPLFSFLRLPENGPRKSLTGRNIVRYPSPSRQSQWAFNHDPQYRTDGGIDD